MRIGSALLSLGLLVGIVAAVLVAGPGPGAAGGEPARERRAAAPTIERPVAEVPGIERRIPPAPSCRPGALEVRAGQALVVGLPQVREPDDDVAQDVIDVGVGGIFITQSNVSDAEQVRRLTATLREASEIPLLVASDEETGRVSSFRRLFGRTASPRAQAVDRSAGEVEAAAAELAVRLRNLGIDWDFAPVADLDAGPAQGTIGDRSFSADADAASEYALAFSRGLADGGVIPTVKHFPGHGGTQDDTHREIAVDDATLPELLARDLVPFVDHIDAGAPVVMLSHVTYTALDPDRPASVSAEAYRLLRQLGFRGVAITDSVGMGAVHRRWKFPDAAVLAVEAGADVVLATDGRQARVMRDALVRAVEDGTLPEARLNEAVARILTLKGIDPFPLTCVEADEDFPEMAPAGGEPPG